MYFPQKVNLQSIQDRIHEENSHKIIMKFIRNILLNMTPWSALVMEQKVNFIAFKFLILKKILKG